LTELQDFESPNSYHLHICINLANPWIQTPLKVINIASINLLSLGSREYKPVPFSQDILFSSEFRREQINLTMTDLLR